MPKRGGLDKTFHINAGSERYRAGGRQAGSARSQHYRTGTPPFKMGHCGVVDKKPKTLAGRNLRSAPWFLAGGALLVLVLRLTVGGSDLPLLLLVALAVVTVIAIFAWAARLDRQARSAGVTVSALFSCSTTIMYKALRQGPQFEQPLRSVRLAWLVGGWLTGRLVLTEQLLTWVPGRWTRRVFRAPALELGWDDVVYANAVDQPGPRDPGILELRLRDSSEVAFMVTRNEELAEALKAVRLP
jgi:hypothetical protein